MAEVSSRRSQESLRCAQDDKLASRSLSPTEKLFTRRRPPAAETPPVRDHTIPKHGDRIHTAELDRSRRDRHRAAVHVRRPNLALERRRSTPSRLCTDIATSSQT
jgi:hypothetical protein